MKRKITLGHRNELSEKALFHYKQICLEKGWFKKDRKEKRVIYNSWDIIQMLEFLSKNVQVFGIEHDDLINEWRFHRRGWKPGSENTYHEWNPDLVETLWDACKIYLEM